MSNLVLLGLVSFFADVSTEMVYPMIPLYLTSVFGATPTLVGIIEGIAESLASLLKVWSGYLTDRYCKKKPLAFLGYSTTVLYKLALILSTSWVGVLMARIIDRFGKGIRTSPRDVLVAESARNGKLGGAFGLHKALDMAGSALGILLAYLLMRQGGGSPDYRRFFLFSILPALGALAVLGLVRERKVPQTETTWKNPLRGFRELDRRLKLFLLIIFCFTLGNSSNAFLLLRAQDVGYSAANVVLLYFVYHLVSSLLALPFGHLSDRIGRRKVLVAGYLCFGLVYLGFALGTSKQIFLLLFALYGVYTALTAGVERALISEIAPPQSRGTMLGVYASLVGVALLPASVLAGFLWKHIGPSAPFFFGGGMAVAAAGAIFFVLRSLEPSSAA
ncbi:MAG: MFS transporter [Intestinimonas sp.]|nr:MFS transporter [Intestinimonas sp.]